MKPIKIYKNKHKKIKVNNREIILDVNPLKNSTKVHCSYHLGSFNEFLFDVRKEELQLPGFAINKNEAKKLALFIIENL